MTVSHKRPVTRWRQAASLVILGLLAALLAGCPDDDDGNTAPTAGNDTATTTTGTPVTIRVLDNDSDADDDPLTVTAITQGANGTVANNNNGTVTYTPKANFVGADTFRYTVSDGQDGTAQATVTVTVTNVAPMAVNDTATTEQDTASAPIMVLTNDTDADGDALTITAVTNGTNGMARIAGTAIIYTPAPGFVGMDTFTYTISDGRATDTATVTVTVTATGFRLTVLHNNDGESQLINAGSGLENFGGVARFATVVQRLRDDATAAGSRVVLLSSGDNFLAGPEFNASLSRTGNERVPFFDTIALDRIGYTAFAIGNHEFDFGPEVLADFITSFTITTPFLSANLDVRGEPRLQELADAGRIARSTVLTVRGRRIGIVGATTPMLPFISSPRNVVVNPNVVGAVQAEIDRLTARGIDIIILISHLQSINEDLELAPQLRNVDIMIAGGGDELLANPDTLLVPGDEAVVFGPYPLEATDINGNRLPIITTSGAYRYVGRLMAEFNAAGRLVRTEATSGPVRVAGGDNPDAVEPDPVVQEEVVDPVVEAIAALDATVIGMTEVALDGQRSAVRSRETNLGNLIADALLAQAQALADDFGAPQPDVALQNGGGIRNDTLIATGDLTELDTFDVLPFANFVAIVPNISAAQFKEILENAVSRVEFTDGRFAQVAGFRFTWDPNGTAQVVDDSGNVTTAGTRVREIVLDDGRPLVQGGLVLDDAPDVNVATIDFSARGGDQYPFRGAAFFTLGVSYQQALANFIMTTLEGLVTAAAYPEGGEGRIVALTPVQVTGRVDDGRPASPIADAACQFVDLEGTVLATTTADADGIFTLEVPPNTQGFMECTPPTLPDLVLRTFASTIGRVGGVLSDQDVSPATTVISNLLQALLASDPTVDLDAMEAALLAELDAEEPHLSVLAGAASALFNAMRDANLDTTTFAVALEDMLADGEINSAALAPIATTVQEAVDAAEQARGTQVVAAFAARIPAQRIRHIQGATHRSPREGQTASIPGIVTALASGGGLPAGSHPG